MNNNDDHREAPSECDWPRSRCALTGLQGGLGHARTPLLPAGAFKTSLADRQRRNVDGVAGQPAVSRKPAAMSRASAAIWCWAALAACLMRVSTDSMATEEIGKTTIHIAFKYRQENLTRGWKGDTLDEFTIVLSAGDKIQVTQHSEPSGRSVQRNIQYPDTLGHGRWRVTGPHRLQRVERFPQNITTIDVVVRGTHCDATMKFSLLPGFKEYTFPQIGSEKLARYAKPLVLASVCSIKGD